MPDLSLKQWVVGYLICIGLLVLAVSQFADAHQGLEVSVLDVGQGDSILIQTPEYHNILIDAGPDSKTVDRLGEELGFFDKTIDLFVLTHPHNDHYGGILDVMQKYRIKKVILTGVVSDDPVYQAFLESAKTDGAEFVFIQNNQDIQIAPDLYLDIIYPFSDYSLVGQSVANANNTSIVARLLKQTPDGWENLIMLTGDTETEEEREILLSGQDVRSDALKVGHHGSKTATSDVFLDAVSPVTAVISVGAGNKFGHPHAETIEKLSGLTVRQTMTEGTIKFNF